MYSFIKQIPKTFEIFSNNSLPFSSAILGLETLKMNLKYSKIPFYKFNSSQVPSTKMSPSTKPFAQTKLSSKTFLNRPPDVDFFQPHPSYFFSIYTVQKKLPVMAINYFNRIQLECHAGTYMHGIKRLLAPISLQLGRHCYVNGDWSLDNARVSRGE